MQERGTSQGSLSDLVRPADFARARQAIFPSVGSFDWFVRQHRARLVEVGALVFLAGRNYVHPSRADQIIAAIGREQAARGMGAGLPSVQEDAA